MPQPGGPRLGGHPSACLRALRFFGRRRKVLGVRRALQAGSGAQRPARRKRGVGPPRRDFASCPPLAQLADEPACGAAGRHAGPPRAFGRRRQQTAKYCVRGRPRSAHDALLTAQRPLRPRQTRRGVPAPGEARRLGQFAPRAAALVGVSQTRVVGRGRLRPQRAAAIAAEPAANRRRAQRAARTAAGPRGARVARVSGPPREQARPRAAPALAPGSPAALPQLQRPAQLRLGRRRQRDDLGLGFELFRQNSRICQPLRDATPVPRSFQQRPQRTAPLPGLLPKAAPHQFGRQPAARHPKRRRGGRHRVH
mmetsp:Transcript_20724/g.70201  ORF Transcript_20724/g.70201 Transcript_20724/m.70201 type:complete len:310 (-) Transcript_20724:33-962(-)